MPIIHLPWNSMMNLQHDSITIATEQESRHYLLPKTLTFFALLYFWIFAQCVCEVMMIHYSTNYVQINISLSLPKGQTISE
jgi:hypothetical protein